MKERLNCFNLMRHVAALTVLFSHNFALNGLHEPVLRSWDTMGFFSVVVFFTISGYLMPISYNSSEGFIHFIIKRIRRLLPAIVICSFIMIFIVSPIFSNKSISSNNFIKESILLFIQHCAFIFNNPIGIFYDFKVPGAMNGSLWTIPIEIVCYLILATSLSFSNSYKTILVLLLLSLIGCLITIYNEVGFVFYGVPIKYLSMFGVAFSTGALLSMTKTKWHPYRYGILIISIIVILSAQTGLELNSICLAAAAFMVIFFGTNIKLSSKGSFDISYGIYIYAFPTQQIIINKVSDDFTTSLILSTIITIILATLSFLFVEKPFLDRNKSAERKTNLPAEIST